LDDRRFFETRDVRKRVNLYLLGAAALALLLLAAGAASAQRAPAGKVGTFRFAKDVGGHKARLVFKTAEFDRSRHRITYGKRLDLKVLEVDGRMALGVDGNVPRTEIRSVEFYFDGRRVAVPRRLYADCFEPSFGQDYFAVKAGDDGGSLLVFMAGSDAAGSYQVVWVLRGDGHHSRFSSPCSDCDYNGFLLFAIDPFALRYSAP
jgi:hypothetical protein